jgi:hypothetical protein
VRITAPVAQAAHFAGIICGIFGTSFARDNALQALIAPLAENLSPGGAMRTGPAFFPSYIGLRSRFGDE